ncbi:hypothetical protein BDZ94DRAFT_851879 [Collybia nuda]|uniref:Uncharacterized protein n=1 Tax=Collybia nuda TaxID=64659 RepID=A0A9P5YGI0_9AGAR|nr:hypothetical protein BDZ94DRAFT_851879 [Collybia nuda]
MLSFKSIVSALAFTALVSAAPTSLEADTELANPFVTVCTGSLNPRAGCADITISTGTCVNFINGFSFLNHEVSNAQIPIGFTCTFFANFNCQSVSDFDSVFLQGGIWNLFNVPGINGNVNFNDQTSSYQCSL